MYEPDLADYSPEEIRNKRIHDLEYKVTDLEGQLEKMRNALKAVLFDKQLDHIYKI